MRSMADSERMDGQGKGRETWKLLAHRVRGIATTTLTARRGEGRYNQSGHCRSYIDGKTWQTEERCVPTSGLSGHVTHQRGGGVTSSTRAGA
jgi:hypothetical protein